MKKEVDEHMELAPLNHNNVSPPGSSSYITAQTTTRLGSSYPSTDIEDKVPSDHLAKLDEFSMISAVLGPRSKTFIIQSRGFYLLKIYCINMCQIQIQIQCFHKT